MDTPVRSTLLTLLLIVSLPGFQTATFKFINRCRHTVWPGLLSGANSPPLPTTGFVLHPGDSETVQVPKSWSGRMWGRSLCGLDSTRKFTCLTGDCGSGSVECAGSGAKPPATLAEFTLNGAGGLDFYDVSLVDGFNLPMLVVPRNGSRGCSATGCLIDLNGGCPRELKLVARLDGVINVACRSACEAFGDPRYCCSGAYSTPDTCGPSAYAQFFKHACPRAYSYAYDDTTSTYTCRNGDYILMFCPPPYTSQILILVFVSGWAREVQTLLLEGTAPEIAGSKKRWGKTPSGEQDYDVHIKPCQQLRTGVVQVQLIADAASTL